MPEQIKPFGPLRDYWDGSHERYIQLIKQKLVNMHQTQSFMSGKLTKVHQSNVLGWMMHNLDPPVAGLKMPRNGMFPTYASKASIINHLMSGKIISSYHHPPHPKHNIVTYCEAHKLPGLIVLQAEILC